MKLALAFGAIGAATVAFVASGLPARGSDNATVAVTVTPKVACLTINTTTVGLGQQSFSDPSNANKAIAQSKPQIALCGANEKVMVHGTDATSSVPSRWTLSGAGGNPCAEGPNVFHQLVVNQGVPAQQQHEVRLTKDESALYPLAGQTGSSFPVQLEMEMPCGGSDGAGVPSTFSYVFTAVA